MSQTRKASRRARRPGDTCPSDYARANSELRRVAARATKLLSVTTALSEATSVKDVVDVVLDKGLSVIEASGGVLVKKDGDRFDVLGSCGIEPDVLSRIARDNAGPLSETMRTREPVWFESIAELRRRFPDSLALERDLSGLHWGASMPLVHSNQTIGGLGLIFFQPRAFGATDRAFTLVLAQAAAAALERALSYDSERQKRHDAELLAQGRQEMLAIVAHDLRNPLNVIAMSNQLPLEGAPSVERRKVVAMNTRAVKQMSRLIDDLLDNLRLQTGTLSLDIEDVSVADIFRDADETFSGTAAERKIKLVIETPDPDLVVRADAVRASQVVGNLLGNALKFVPEHGVVELHASRDGPRVIFAVRDTGPGISAGDACRLFDKFWQGRKGDLRGVGLGLTIAKGLVEAQGGTIWLESQVGAGTTFYFTLPTASASRSA